MNVQAVFEQIKQNVIAHFSLPSASPEEYLVLMEVDGSFRDIDYITQNWTAWGPFQHMMRLQKLCIIYGTPQNTHYHNPMLKEAICKGFCYYLNGNFRSDNWWMLDVGVPGAAGQMRLFCNEIFCEEEQTALLKLAQGNPKSPPHYHPPFQRRFRRASSLQILWRWYDITVCGYLYLSGCRL